MAKFNLKMFDLLVDLLSMKLKEPRKVAKIFSIADDHIAAGLSIA
jgi:hypothetical protein